MGSIGPTGPSGNQPSVQIMISSQNNPVTGTFTSVQVQAAPVVSSLYNMTRSAYLINLVMSISCTGYNPGDNVQMLATLNYGGSSYNYFSVPASSNTYFYAGSISLANSPDYEYYDLNIGFINNNSNSSITCTYTVYSLTVFGF